MTETSNGIQAVTEPLQQIKTNDQFNGWHRSLIQRMRQVYNLVCSSSVFVKFFILLFESIYSGKSMMDITVFVTKALNCTNRLSLLGHLISSFDKFNAKNASTFTDCKPSKCELRNTIQGQTKYERFLDGNQTEKLFCLLFIHRLTSFIFKWIACKRANLCPFRMNRYSFWGRFTKQTEWMKCESHQNHTNEWSLNSFFPRKIYEKKKKIIHCTCHAFMKCNFRFKLEPLVRTTMRW